VEEEEEEEEEDGRASMWKQSHSPTGSSQWRPASVCTVAVPVAVSVHSLALLITGSVGLTSTGFANQLAQGLMGE
jgi:uncharacterized membrane protein YdfJ with MMPL/SSD domain